MILPELGENIIEFYALARVSVIVSLSALFLHRKILALFRRSVHHFQVS
jgi:hypothetical protein